MRGKSSKKDSFVHPSPLPSPESGEGVARPLWGFGRAVRAFTLTEVLIALAIFALGFVSIASVFPVAVVLQKETVEDLLSQQIERNVEAALQGRPFTDAELEAHPNLAGADLKVHPFLQKQGGETGDALDPPGRISPGNWEKWKLNDRSYFFMGINGPGYYPAHTAEVEGMYASEYKRTYYWVPLVRRAAIPTNPEDWRVYVFILRRDAEAYDRNDLTPAPWDGWANWDGFLTPSFRVPGVYGMPVNLAPSDVTRFNFDNDRNNDGRPDEIQAGDQVLDSNGTVHSVVTADATGVNVSGPILSVPETPNTLWYGRPAAAGKKSPTRGVLVLTGGNPPSGVVVP